MRVLLVLLLSGCASYLPHRPLSEIDIQGHQDGTPEDKCPGRHEYYGIDDKGVFFIECF